VRADRQGALARRSRWERNAEFWVRIIRERLDPFRTELTDAAVLRALGPCDGKVVLDAGCGEGYLARRFAGRGATAFGIDRSSGLIEAAAAAAGRAAGRSRFLVGDLRALPLPAGCFDAVVCNHSLNELRDLRPVFAEFGRVLKPGGVLVVLMLHPCFYGGRDASGERIEVDTDRYFAARRVEQRFNVSGLISPAPTVIWVRPLESYFALLADAGFCVERLWEPRPSRRLMTQPWWRDNFRKPLFLLWRAVRR
jgi:SAM-dependent methyltransferase